MNYLKIVINETACNSPKVSDDTHVFNQIVEKKKTIEEVEEFLKDRYGKVISKKHREKRGVFVDDKNGQAKRVGFLFSFWNKDWSHNSKSWFQTDWIEIMKVEEQVVLI